MYMAFSSFCPEKFEQSLLYIYIYIYIYIYSGSEKFLAKQEKIIVAFFTFYLSILEGLLVIFYLVRSSPIRAVTKHLYIYIYI